MNTSKPTMDSRPHEAITGMSAALIPVPPDMNDLTLAWDDDAIPMFDQDVDDEYSLREELDCFRRERDFGLD